MPPPPSRWVRSRLAVGPTAIIEDHRSCVKHCRPRVLFFPAPNRYGRVIPQPDRPAPWGSLTPPGGTASAGLLLEAVQHVLPLLAGGLRPWLVGLGRSALVVLLVARRQAPLLMVLG